MAIFGPKPWATHFGTSCFYSPESRFFVLKYRKRHFPGLYFLKNKSWKNGRFSNFYFSGNIDQKNGFYDILERKDGFLGYEIRK